MTRLFFTNQEKTISVEVNSRVNRDKDNKIVSSSNTKEHKVLKNIKVKKLLC